mgnify:CR=1 FL=1
MPTGGRGAVAAGPVQFDKEAGFPGAGEAIAGVQAQETTTPHLLDAGSFILRAGPEADAAVFQRGHTARLEPGVRALADAGLTAYHAAAKAAKRLTPRDRCVVVGAGGLGHIGIQVLKALTPAELIVVDREGRCTVRDIIVTIDPRNVDGVFEIGLTQGKFSDLTPDTIFVSQKYAKNNKAAVGDTINITLADAVAKSAELRDEVTKNPVAKKIYDQALVLEGSHIVADRGRGQLQARRLGQGARTDGLAFVDVALDQDLEQ